MEKFEYYYWTDLINKEEIKNINNICKDKKDIFAIDRRTPPLEKKDHIIKTSSVEHIMWLYLKSPLHNVWENWMEANQEYFGFDLYGIMDRTYVNYNVYDSSNKGEYETHKDATPVVVSDIKLTAMVNISEEPYEGGDFCMLDNDKMKKIDVFVDSGSSIIFKSWIPHQVTPVTKGVRKTLSIWLLGPRLR